MNPHKEEQAQQRDSVNSTNSGMWRENGGAKKKTKVTDTTRTGLFGGSVVVTRTVVTVLEMTLTLPPFHQWHAYTDWEANDHLVQHTFSFLNVAELLNMKRLSRKWRDICTRAINNKCPNPPKAIESKQELKDAITKYCRYDPKAMEELVYTYGYPINKWDVSRVTDFSHIFENKFNFNEYIGDWNVSNATTMAYMFYGACVFNQPLTNWNTSKVTTMYCMFFNAFAFNQPFTNWNTSNVTNMARMFRNASTFNQPVNHFDTSQVTDMTRMFFHASAFNQCLTSWDCSNVIDKYHMFAGAAAFSYTDQLPAKLHRCA